MVISFSGSLESSQASYVPGVVVWA